MIDRPNTWTYRAMLVVSAVGGAAWLLIGSVLLWWAVQPVTLPTIKEPIPILNPGNRVTVGEPVLLELRVDKPQDLDSTGSDRFLMCESGNLVTLTPSARQLPPGQYTILSDSIVMPAKVTSGDTCTVLFVTEFQVNPIRHEKTRHESEPFVVEAAP